MYTKISILKNYNKNKFKKKYFIVLKIGVHYLPPYSKHIQMLFYRVHQKNPTYIITVPHKHEESSHHHPRV
jgi:hypothetical protein